MSAVVFTLACNAHEADRRGCCAWLPRSLARSWALCWGRCPTFPWPPSGLAICSCERLTSDISVYRVSNDSPCEREPGALQACDDRAPCRLSLWPRGLPAENAARRIVQRRLQIMNPCRKSAAALLIRRKHSSPAHRACLASKKLQHTVSV